jgi:hypothetical protein
MKDPVEAVITTLIIGTVVLSLALYVLSFQ